MLHITQVHINSQAINLSTQFSTIILDQIGTRMNADDLDEAQEKLNR